MALRSHFVESCWEFCVIFAVWSLDVPFCHELMANLERLVTAAVTAVVDFSEIHPVMVDMNRTAARYFHPVTSFCWFYLFLMVEGCFQVWKLYTAVMRFGWPLSVHGRTCSKDSEWLTWCFLCMKRGSIFVQISAKTFQILVMFSLSLPSWTAEIDDRSWIQPPCIGEHNTRLIVCKTRKRSVLGCHKHNAFLVSCHLRNISQKQLTPKLN